MDSLPPGAAPRHVWQGVYSTWEEACAAANAIGGPGLPGERWSRKITQQIVDYRNELQEHGVALPPRPTSLPMVCATTNSHTILDFGGSSGWGWDYLRAVSPENGVTSYVIVETDEVVDYMRRTDLHKEPLTYRSMHDPLGRCDLLYCNSVLQYLESNAPLLSLVERTKPTHIFLEDLVARGEEDFFSLQNYWESAIPYRFLGLQRLLRELLDLGFSECVRLPYASPILGVTKPLEMENFPVERRLRYSLSILFRRPQA